MEDRGRSPQDMLDRRVEITGPTDRKMVINALNCGASTFMADFEDAELPDLAQHDRRARSTCAMRCAARITLEQGGKQYKLNDKTAVLIPRPRGWHLDEKHVLIDGKPVSGAHLRFRAVLLPQRQGAAQARHAARISTCRRWNRTSRRGCGTTSSWWRRTSSACRRARSRATVLIETVLAAFEMDEILWELRDHSAGLNIGRWDYIFSCIKKFRSHKDFCLADRAQVTMTAPFMRAYALLLVKTCHRRNAPAMGGMAAQIPIKNDPAANEAAMEKVRQDKLREVTDGCDGTWVAHPGLVPIAKAVFDKHMPEPNQYDQAAPGRELSRRRTCSTSEPETPITEAGLRNNISVGIQYLGRLARRQRLRAGVQPDGGRGHRRDLALADLAVDPLAEGRARRRPQGDHASCSGSCSPKSCRR